MDGRETVADLMEDAPEWQERALCAQTDPEAFFPEKGGRPGKRSASARAARCRRSAWNTHWARTSGSASGADCPNANGES
ncbi:hypothetical protein Athai_49490 [Actinocatenispora thailandica]|uniref:4Fe-4S Wbl-type domain-containing protein n=1 Tax=Actinocatenispora thailandica TaxID=227318 RepID=A0A7R7HZF3_9ACTN|nr:hypothetical protein Athai_49490 [Actinocatenispora thailandica]